MNHEDKTGVSRRGVLGGTAVAGVAALSGGGAYLESMRRANAAVSTEVKPGDLDEYYAINSSGQTGEVRIQVLPSGRELMRIPVFNRDSATGWGLTNESKKILTEGLLPETRKFLESRGGTWVNGDAASPAHVVHRRHLRRPLHLRERQGELPGRAHPLRRHEDRQDHRDPQRLGHPWSASAEVPAHRLYFRQQRARDPDPQ